MYYDIAKMLIFMYIIVFKITILVVPQVILPYIVFNSSISTVTNITRHYFYSTWRVNAPRPITLLGSAYPSIYVSLV